MTDAYLPTHVINAAKTAAVATALRKPLKDGRVKIRYTKGLGFGAEYRFVRLKAKVQA